MWSSFGTASIKMCYVPRANLVFGLSSLIDGGADLAFGL
jgi:hypothetical protein